ncbi:sterol desaturase family protein [Chitinimonas sp. BJYL2]|uniref:sterol desaturase family protein n=1 Tax=Chitinimonas sp. BJYL2 TaxID=2976696 RepID=UPI0022B42FCB|nr:sterol desaturase family protein [Chitinimonas sp. BJYL2]
MLNPIVYAVPVFLLLILIELAVGYRRGLLAYRGADFVSSMSLGIFSQLTGVFTKVVGVTMYALAYDNLALFALPQNAIWVWIGALVLYDFLYYWLHRMGHEVNILWAAHVVHHSSEEYNLSTALRQTSTGFLLGWIFYLPMAVLGVPPLVFVVVGLIDLLYQFWVHTRQIGKLGWFDRVFVSPSNHRVHHGQNDYCLDRNYGGILIIWDRLFGTFVEERDDEEIVYGIRGQLGTWSPLRANLHVYGDLLRDSRLADNWLDRIKVWFMDPGWRPASAIAKAPKADYDIHRFQRYAPALPKGMALYALSQFVLVLVLAIHFLIVQPLVSLSAAALYAGLLMGSLWTLAALLENRRSGIVAEWLRLALFAGIVLIWGAWFGVAQLGMPIMVTTLALALGSAIWLLRIVRQPELTTAAAA